MSEMAIVKHYVYVQRSKITENTRVFYLGKFSKFIYRWNYPYIFSDFGPRGKQKRTEKYHKGRNFQNSDILGLITNADGGISSGQAH